MVSTNQLRYLLFLAIFFILWLLTFLHSYHQTRIHGKSIQQKLDFIDNTLENNLHKNLSEVYQKLEETEQRLRKMENALDGLTLRAQGGVDNIVERDTASTKKTPHADGSSYKIAVLIIACSRVEVKSIIQQTLKYSPGKETFPLFVSQDCGERATKQAILEFRDDLTYLEHKNLSAIDVEARQQHMVGYYKISRHYKWAIDQVFAASEQIDSVVILEDDMMISSDFFAYFKSMRPLLDMDETLWCVSAWNDNGKQGLVSDNSLFYRTDFMPGLGWMLTRRVWEELRVKWPPSFWDDWMRGNEVRRNRACIRPEVSRTKLYVQRGVSGGLYFDKFYQYWVLNEHPFNFERFDIKSLTKPIYDRAYFKKISEAELVPAGEVANSELASGVEYKVGYQDYAQYKKLANQFGLMDDERGGVLRTAYYGVVSFYHLNTYVHLVPQNLMR